MTMRQHVVVRELRGASTTANEASVSAAAKKYSELQQRKREGMNRMNGVGEEEDRHVGGRTCGDVWA